MKTLRLILLLTLVPLLSPAQNYFYVPTCGVSSIIGTFKPSDAFSYTNANGWMLYSNASGWNLKAAGYSGLNTNVIHASGANPSANVNGDWPWNGAGIFTNTALGGFQIQICSGSYAGLWGYCNPGSPQYPATVSVNLITNTWSLGYPSSHNGDGLVTAYLVVTNSFTAPAILGPWTNTIYAVYTNPAPVFSIIPPTLPIAPASLTNFLPVAGGTLTLSASGISVATNESVVVTDGTNLFYHSPPTLVAGGLFNLSGTFQMDASNNLTTYFSLSGAGINDSSFSLVTNFTGTNFSFVVGSDSTLDTNLILTAVNITSRQAVGSIQPVFTWPPAPAVFTGTKTLYTVNSTNTAIITNTLVISNGVINSWLP